MTINSKNFYSLKFLITLAILFAQPPACLSSAADISQRPKSAEFYHEKNLSSLEVSIFESARKNFEILKKDKYSKKYIFAALARVSDGKIIFSTDAAFYKKKISPGSIIKIFDFALILKYYKGAETAFFYCTDIADIGGLRYNCSQKGGHGQVDLHSALKKSCNLYFKKFMQSIPRYEFCNMLKLCGFIDSAEETAILSQPLPDYFQSVIGGKIIEVTPEKLLEFTRFLASPDAPDGRFTHYREAFDRNALLKIGSAMRKAASEGTAANVLSERDCAVKTGSSQISVRYEKHKKITLTSAVIAGYTPYACPEYAFVAFCERGAGGTDAAKIAGCLIDSIEACKAGRFKRP